MSNLEIVIWDVQHGNATYIKTPDGKHFVQDLGTGSYGENRSEFSPLLYLKNRYKVERLNGVIVTHPHRDHLDDIFNFDALSPHVFSRPKHLTAEEVNAGNRERDVEVVEKYLEIDAKYTYPVPEDENPFLPDNNGGVRFQKFLPTSCATSNLNNHSIVTIIEYVGVKFILPGDNEPASWRELLEQTDFGSVISDAELLLAPHHGRDSGFCSDIFDDFNPLLTIISDGRFCDTSATARYGRITQGWNVRRRGGDIVERKCVTTRNDGVIVVKIGTDYDGYIEVTID